MWVDTHVGLHNEAFSEDRAQVISRAREAGVTGLFNICQRLDEVADTIAVAEGDPHIWASVGTHPHHAKDAPAASAADITQHCGHADVIGIGETGLDFHYNHSTRHAQFENFQAHIDAARETELPLIVHTRNADAEMADILSAEMRRGGLTVLLHCYSSGPELARLGADLGCWFALSGILTFKNAHEVREIAAFLPRERVMLETDCPYLAPVPHRGRRNEPAWLPHIGTVLSDVWKTDVDTVRSSTTNAFFECFQKARRDT